MGAGITNGGRRFHDRQNPHMLPTRYLRHSRIGPANDTRNYSVKGLTDTPLSVTPRVARKADRWMCSIVRAVFEVLRPPSSVFCPPSSVLRLPTCPFPEPTWIQFGTAPPPMSSILKTSRAGSTRSEDWKRLRREAIMC